MMEKMNPVRYRTESFSGTKERDAAEVMAFETFELGNTDILEYVSKHHLKDESLIAQCMDFIKELDANGYVDDMGTNEKIDFSRSLLAEVEKQTGITVKYALWLADKSTVCNREWYGQNMIHNTDFDSYEVGPVILSDLGYDGALYGYTEQPICLEDRIFELQDELSDILNELVDRSNGKQADQLNTRYLEVHAAIQEISTILADKSVRDISTPIHSLSEQIQSAADRLRDPQADSKKEDLYER